MQIALNILKTVKKYCSRKDIFKHKKVLDHPCEDFLKTLDTTAKDDILHESESGESITYLIAEDPDSVFSS